MRKTCFIGNVHPEQLSNYYLKCGKNNFSSNNFNNQVIKEAFKIIDNFTVLSCPQVGRYPFSTKTKSLEKFRISDNYICLGHSNFAFFDVYSSSRAIYKEFCKRYPNKNEEINVIVCEAGMAFLLAFNKIKKHYKKISSTLIVFDLPENVEPATSNKIYLLLKRQSIKKIHKLYSLFDTFVLLAESMNSKVNLLNKPYKVFPCIVDFSLYEGIKTDKIEKNIITITYSGALNSKYNIDLLVDAFKIIDSDNNYRLQIIGDGDFKEQIIQEASKNSRIEYLGLVEPAKAKYYQLNSSVLVNPRLPNQNYANESFPSKTTSYLLTYKPVVSYVFASTPADIASLLISPEGFDAASLAKAIQKACHVTIDKKKTDLILEKYTSKQFVLAILDLLNHSV